jgi:hypothetical protein
VFPNVGMPHVLWELSGTPARRRRSSPTTRPRRPRRSPPRASRWSSRCPGGKYAVRTIANETPGTMTPVEYRAFVADLVNYLDYMGEPVRNKRISLGIIVLIFLGVLFVFAYWLKREYWKDVH